MGVSMVNAPAQLDNFATWSGINGCQINLDTVTHNDQLTHTQWIDCHCQSEIQYFLTKDGGHSWPGGRATPLGDPVSRAINANDLMWEFFERHELPCNQSTTTSDVRATKQFEVHPNISIRGHFEIPHALDKHILKLMVLDLSGAIVQENGDPWSIDLSQYTAGIYFIKILSKSGMETHRVIRL